MENNVKNDLEIKKKQRRAIFAVFLYLAGLTAFAYVNWYIALGSFLIMWGNNIVSDLTIDEDVCRVLNNLMDKIATQKTCNKTNQATNETKSELY